MTARADVLSALSICRVTRSRLLREERGYIEAADFLASHGERGAADICRMKAAKLVAARARVEIDLRRVENLEELSR